jgi:hypothetical protein
MVSLFPVSLKWDARAPVRHAVWWALVLVASGYFLRSLGPASDSATGLPTITWWAVPAAAAVYGVGTAFHSRPPIRRGMTGVAAVAVALALAAAVAAADRRVFAEANAAWEAEELSYAGGEPSSSGWREIFLAVRNAERGVRGVCSARRFFSLIRDDEPLALQPPDLSSLVFYAGRDVKATRAAGPIGPCDYIVTTLALEGTDQGRALVEALLGGGREVRVANVGHFVVIGSGS